MFDLTGKVVLLTGAAGGIGRAISKTLFDQGATLVLTDRGQEGLDALKASLGNDPKVFTIVQDLATEDDAKSLIEKTVEQAGGLDVLVNNAGITKDGLAMRMSDADWDAVLAVNLRMPFFLSKAAIKPMMKKRFGRIINMASIVGVTGNPGQCNYAASKGGLIAMGKSLAVEVATRGITVNAIAPGFIATPMTEKLTQEQKDALTQNIPMKQLGSAQDIANTVVFLASDESEYITGQTINVNGGMARI
jgi:3-oxoacyl-[acyl-carrier protein] reductase